MFPQPYMRGRVTAHQCFHAPVMHYQFQLPTRTSWTETPSIHCCQGIEQITGRYCWCYCRLWNPSPQALHTEKSTELQNWILNVTSIVIYSYYCYLFVLKFINFLAAVCPHWLACRSFLSPVGYRSQLHIYRYISESISPTVLGHKRLNYLCQMLIFSPMVFLSLTT